jgi:hypothetical protein
MIEGVASQFVSLFHQLAKVISGKEFTGSDRLPHESEGSVVGPDEAVFAEDCASLEQGRAGEIIESKRDDRRLQLDTAEFAGEPASTVALETISKFDEQLHQLSWRGWK